MKSIRRCLRLVMLIAAGIAATVSCTRAQVPAAVNDPSQPFVPFEQWKAAVISGNEAALKALYGPGAEIEVKRVTYDANADTSFWLGLKAKSMKVEIVRLVIRPERASVIFKAQVESGGSNRIATVIDAQGWQKKGDQWLIAGAERTDEPQLKQPTDMKKDIYPASVDAHAEIKEAEEKAVRLHKRLLLVFGANWCFDCHVLDLAFQRPDMAPILAANYEVVHIDLGPDEKKNPDLVQQYEIPLNKGVPALAVAESDGKLVVSQKNGEFEDARALTPDVLIEFLNKWKPQG